RCIRRAEGWGVKVSDAIDRIIAGGVKEPLLCQTKMSDCRCRRESLGGKGDAARGFFAGHARRRVDPGRDCIRPRFADLDLQGDKVVVKLLNVLDQDEVLYRPGVGIGGRANDEVNPITGFVGAESREQALKWDG